MRYYPKNCLFSLSALQYIVAKTRFESNYDIKIYLHVSKIGLRYRIASKNLLHFSHISSTALVKVRVTQITDWISVLVILQ